MTSHRFLDFQGSGCYPREPMRIHRLPSDIAEKIAAGEVVERPFSVVKELVENSLDAQASRIEIFIEDGGRKLIRVQDDGYGMSAEEIQLSIERHATSKISTLEDLFSIHTLGFRGEALPSIGSISRFQIKSRPRETSTDAGSELSIEGGKILHQHEAAHPFGTTMEVRDLFFNTPARLKFLKSNETEWGHIENYLTAMALAFPEVQFIAYHNGKEKLRFIQRSLENRIQEVLSVTVGEGFYPIHAEQNEMILQGYVGHPNLSRSHSQSMYLFLNQRPIKDRLLNHAILAGYRNLLMKEQYPCVVLYLHVPPDQVDVNVHPAKREVRFTHPNLVHQFVASTLQKTLAECPWNKKNEISSPGFEVMHENLKRSGTPSTDFSKITQETQIPQIKPSNAFYLNPHSPDPFSEADKKITGSWFSENYQPLKEESAWTIIGREPFAHLRVIGQLKGTYILCESENYFILIDQHAAHERIGFEQLRTRYQSGNIPCQKLLIPQTLEVRESQKNLLINHAEALEKLGMEIAEFGPTTLVVQSLPEVLGHIEVAPLMEALVEDLEEFEVSSKLEDHLDKIFATMACHRQIRAGDSLSHEEMRALIRQLDEGAASYHCPHGRPVMVQIEFREIEKWFKRIV